MSEKISLDSSVTKPIITELHYTFLKASTLTFKKESSYPLWERPVPENPLYLTY